MTFPDFRPDPASNNGQCSVHIHGTPCTSTAAWHLDLGHDPDGTRQLSFTCTPHMDLIQTEHVYAGRHPYGPACGHTSWELCAQESGWQPSDGERRSLAASAERAAEAMRALHDRLAFDLHPDLQPPDEEPTP